MDWKERRHAIGRRDLLKGMIAGAAGVWGGAGMSFAEEAGTGAGPIRLERQETGAEVFQVTYERFSQSNIYCELPYCSRDSRWLVYERRTRRVPENPIEFVRVEVGTWKQEVLDVSPGMSGSAITVDGIFYYLKKVGEESVLMRADLADGKPEQVFRFEDAPWTWSLGTVTRDGRYYVRGKRLDDSYKLFGIVLFDLKTGEQKLLDRDPFTFNAHPQIDPGTGRQIMIQHNRGGALTAEGKIERSVGPEGATLFLLSLPEGKRTELQVGTPYTSPVTGHEAWAGTTGEILLTVSGRDGFTPEKGNLLGVRPGQPARVVARGFKFNHLGATPCGRYFTADDYQGTAKIIVGSVRTGKTAVVCESRASMGRAQNTHAHPYLTPDLKWVIFNSDRGGFPHVHAASVPTGMIESLA